MPAPPPSPVAPVIADRFELHHQLGRGGMATVWEATDRRLGRRVAIKLLREDASTTDASKTYAQRMEQEARAAARIADPRVVTVLDLDHTADGLPFLVLELLSGETLADQLADGPLEESRLRRLRDDLLGALAAAHEAGVLHRDVKPSNVLVDGDGYQVGDFGLASFGDSPADDTDHMGTVAYVAPERFGGAPASAEADVFAAGAVLYEAASGQAPFRRGSVPETVAAMRAGAFDPLQIGTRVGPALAHAIHRALSPDPSERPADARALLELSGQGDAQHLDHTVVIDGTMTLPTSDAIDAPTTSFPAADVTRTVEAPEPLSPTGEQPAVAPPPPRPTSGRPTAGRPTTGRGGFGIDTDVLRRPPVLFVAAAIGLLLLALIAVAVGGGNDDQPAEPGVLSGDPAAADLDATLDQIEEYGR